MSPSSQLTLRPSPRRALILDALNGDHSNFVRDDELDIAWKIFTPILHYIEGALPSLRALRHPR